MALAAEQSITEAMEWDDATLASVVAELAHRAERMREARRGR